MTEFSSDENAEGVLKISFDPLNVNMPSRTFLEWEGGGEKISKYSNIIAEMNKMRLRPSNLSA